MKSLKSGTSRLARGASLIVATFWVGSLWTVGYLVAPTLFGTLSDRAVAGSIAGSIFLVEAWASIGCALALLALIHFSADQGNAGSRKIESGLIAGMLACTLLGYFALHPFMAELRQAAGASGMMTPDAMTRFGILHGISSVIYLVESLLGGLLILKIR
jgi:hypothetical protein